MFHNNRTIHIASFIGLLIVTLIGCQMFERHTQLLTTPATGENSDVANYAQMEDGSTVVDGQQINWVVSEWGAFPYGNWIYVEVNQQDAVGYPPGERQVPVTLRNVVLSFNDLPDEITQILTGVKAVHDDTDTTFNELGRFDVVDGSVNIPLAYADLTYYFGVTHYGIWFQAIGGKDGEGTACGQFVLSGTMPGGQDVSFTKILCFGTTPTPTPTPTRQKFFEIDFDTLCGSDYNPWTSPIPVSGSTAELHKEPGDAVCYERYSINFICMVDGQEVQCDFASKPVTITWQRNFCAADFLWGDTNTDDGSMTIQVPRNGGTVGESGTVLDTGWRKRPEVNAGCSDTLGTVVFEAPGVTSLTITVIRP